jgi:hypothetical protein
MSMKTILVPMENNDMQSALETALLLGQRNNSYIEGFALRWQVIELIAGIDAMGGIPLDRFKEDVEEEAKKAKQIFEIFMQDHGVPRSTETTETVSFGWLDHAAEGEGFIGNYGRVFDVIVMNRRDANSGPMHDRVWSIRKRATNTTVSTVASKPDCNQRVDRMELQHRAGTSHCPRDADSSESRPRYDPDGHWRNGSAGPLG